MKWATVIGKKNIFFIMKAAQHFDSIAQGNVDPSQDTKCLL